MDSTEKYLDTPEAIGLDGIDLEKYIIASYIIKRPKGMNVNYLSRFAAMNNRQELGFEYRLKLKK